MIMKNVKEKIQAEVHGGYSSKEVVVPKEGLLDKVKLGFKYLDSKKYPLESKLDSIYIKFKESSKRKFYWTIWESGRGRYESYLDFKNSWNPDTKIWKQIKNEIKKDIKTEIEEIIRIKDPFSSSKGRRVDINKTKQLYSKKKSR